MLNISTRIEARLLLLMENCCYLEVVQVVSSIQIDPFGLLVHGHDSHADVQRAVKLPPLDLKHKQEVSFSGPTSVGPV